MGRGTSMNSFRQTVKIDDLSGCDLDLAVARALGRKDALKSQLSPHIVLCEPTPTRAYWIEYSPTTKWFQGGPIIDSENINIESYFNRVTNRREYVAYVGENKYATTSLLSKGDSHLEASMKVFVKIKFGENIDIEEIIR